MLADAQVVKDKLADEIRQVKWETEKFKVRNAALKEIADQRAKEREVRIPELDVDPGMSIAHRVEIKVLQMRRSPPPTSSIERTKMTHSGESKSELCELEIKPT